MIVKPTICNMCPIRVKLMVLLQVWSTCGNARKYYVHPTTIGIVLPRSTCDIIGFPLFFYFLYSPSYSTQKHKDSNKGLIKYLFIMVLRKSVIGWSNTSVVFEQLTINCKVYNINHWWTNQRLILHVLALQIVCLLRYQFLIFLFNSWGKYSFIDEPNLQRLFVVQPR